MPAGRVVDEPPPSAGQTHRARRRRDWIGGEHLDASCGIARQATDAAGRLLDKQEIVAAVGHLDRRNPAGNFDLGTVPQIRQPGSQVAPVNLYRPQSVG